MAKTVDPIADTLRACAIGAVGGPVVFFAVGILATIGDGSPPFDPLPEIPSFLGFFILIWAITIIPAVMIGVPLSLLLQRFRMPGFLPNVVVFSACGALIQLLIALSLSGFDHGLDHLSEVGVIAGVGAACGFVISAIAWLIRRPDRDLPKEVSPSAP